MPFLEFLFSPQAHKFRNGYNINQDTLMNGIHQLIEWAKRQGENWSSTSSQSSSPKSWRSKTELPMKPKGTSSITKNQKNRIAKSSLDIGCFCWTSRMASIS